MINKEGYGVCKKNNEYQIYRGTRHTNHGMKMVYLYILEEIEVLAMRGVKQISMNLSLDW